MDKPPLRNLKACLIENNFKSDQELNSEALEALKRKFMTKQLSSSAKVIASSIPQLRLKAAQKMWLIKFQILDICLGDKDA